VYDKTPTNPSIENSPRSCERQSCSPEAVVIPEGGLEQEHVRIVGDPVARAGVMAGVPAPRHPRARVRLLQRELA
jgi:hypothetical protein